MVRPPNIDAALRIDTKGRRYAGLFVSECQAAACGLPRRARPQSASKNFSRCTQLFVMMRYYGLSRLVGHRNMRAFALGLIFSAAASPCLAQTVLKSEPLILAPYEVAFVQDPSCGAGKVRKVTGAIRGLQRRKACVTLASEQVSLVSATP
ncbi:hypothetical protein V1290_001168 [Bradyrhizobium sp. AZCC 1578]|uniref:hypothetical protein n=1 Tax=Bradyrhizobium sp. AZCC 1578 TaxID=3117027 RepID=UPI00306F100D